MMEVPATQRFGLVGRTLV